MVSNRLLKMVFFLSALAGITEGAWGFNPTPNPKRQDPTREAGIYRIELARFKESQVKQLQELLDHQGAIDETMGNEETAGEMERMTGDNESNP